MANELYLHTLQQIRDGCLAENMDTEAEALEAAIQALSCGGDCISRQAAIDVASGYCHLANVADELRKLPSAQPGPQSPCDLCVHNPPSSMDGKPCCMCVAEPWREKRHDKRKVR